MATVTKWYVHDVATPNFGRFPTDSPANMAGGVVGAGTEAPGASTARDASGTIGTANPDTKATCTSAATTSAQRLGIRRFVTRPLAAKTFAAADGNWTWSFAASESNAAHNGKANLWAYLWRPQTNARVGTEAVIIVPGEPGITETAQTATGTWTGTTTIQEGDVIVMDIYDEFTQGGAVSRTFSLSYDGTTEANTTTCASFLSSPAALTLSDHPWPRRPDTNFQNPAVFMKGAFGYAKRNWLWKPLRRPSLWTPELWRPEFWLPDHVAQGEIAI